MLPDVRVARGRPPVVLVTRDGDPSGAVAVAVTTAGLDGTSDEDAEAAVALAGVVESRLSARGLSPVVVPSWSGFRAAVLVSGTDAAKTVTLAVRETLAAPIDHKDLAAAKKKLAALAARPLRDASLARWARCVGSPHATPQRAGKSGDDLTTARLENWRTSAHGIGRVALAVAAKSAVAESVAEAIARGPAWNTGLAAPATTPTARAIDVDVYDAAAATPAALVVHATLDVGTASDAVTTAEALGDPHGPLASRLAALELPFRLREVVGTAEPRGGCVAMVLEATSSTSLASGDLATRVADAVALVHVEAQVHLMEGGRALDGRTLARRAGDAREAAERAAWWGLADAWVSTSASDGDRPLRGSVAVGVPSRRGGAPGAGNEVALNPSREALAAAVARSTTSWQKPVAEGRARVEPGQGETWVLVASPCGADGESDADAGLTALFTVAAADMAQSSPEARVEPWIVPDGAGLLVHGPALPGESASAQARRLADIAARSFAADAVTPVAIARARAFLLRPDARTSGPALGALASAMAPGHASWIVATGREDALARAADAAVLTRAQALRAGPIRVAVLANVDAAQGDAALRAADRWVDRRAGGEGRACRAATAAAPSRPGTYAVEARPGAAPEAYLAFPIAAGDARARLAAGLVATALDGEGGLLEKALGAPGMARSWSAHVVGWPRSPALVVHIVSTQAALDAAVMQARALVDRLRKSGLGAAEFERATLASAREALGMALDPRARVVATWRREPIPTSAQPAPGGLSSAEDVRAFASKHLVEDTMVIVAARPARTKAVAP